MAIFPGGGSGDQTRPFLRILPEDSVVEPGVQWLTEPPMGYEPIHLSDEVFTDPSVVMGDPTRDFLAQQAALLREHDRQRAMRTALGGRRPVEQLADPTDDYSAIQAQQLAERAQTASLGFQRLQQTYPTIPPIDEAPYIHYDVQLPYADLISPKHEVVTPSPEAGPMSTEDRLRAELAESKRREVAAERRAQRASDRADNSDREARDARELVTEERHRTEAQRASKHHFQLAFVIAVGIIVLLAWLAISH